MQAKWFAVNIRQAPCELRDRRGFVDGANMKSHRKHRALTLGRVQRCRLGTLSA